MATTRAKLRHPMLVSLQVFISLAISTAILHSYAPRRGFNLRPTSKSGREKSVFLS